MAKGVTLRICDSCLLDLEVLLVQLLLERQLLLLQLLQVVCGHLQTALKALQGSARTSQLTFLKEYKV